jgi:hypothetical protein
MQGHNSGRQVKVHSMVDWCATRSKYTDPGGKDTGNLCPPNNATHIAICCRKEQRVPQAGQLQA